MIGVREDNRIWSEGRREDGGTIQGKGNKDEEPYKVKRAKIMREAFKVRGAHKDEGRT